MKKLKRLFSLCLCLALCFTVMPVIGITTEDIQVKNGLHLQL